MKTTTSTSYRKLQQYEDLIFDLYNRGRSFREIAGAIEEQEGYFVHRKRISEFIKLSTDSRKYSPNLVIKDSRKGSDVYQIKEQYIKAIDAIPEIKSPNNPTYTDRSFNVFCMSDLHIGQLIKPVDVDNANEYNEEIIIKRLETVFGQLQQLENKDKLYVFSLGDLVHGDLPNKQDFILSQEYGIVRQTLRAKQIISNFFKRLLEEFNSVEVYATSGNHGRLPNKSHMPNVQRAENFDWMLMELLKEEYQNNPRLSFHNTESFYNVFELHGVRFIITHGHQLGVSMYGDAIKMFQNLNMQYSPEKTADVVVHGHFHHYTAQELPHHKKMIGASSLVGPDPYARNALMRSSVPSQMLLTFEENRRSRKYVNTGVRLLYVD